MRMSGRIFAKVFGMILALWGLLPLPGAAEENPAGSLFKGLQNYVQAHRTGREYIVWEDDIPDRFKQDLDLDRLYAPFNLPYSLAAVALYYDSINLYERSAYFYRKAFEDALVRGENGALPMVVLSRTISQQVSGEISRAFEDIAGMPRLWNDAYARWTVDVAIAYLSLSMGDYETTAKAIEKSQEKRQKLWQTSRGKKPLEQEFGPAYLIFQMEKIQGAMKYLQGDFAQAVAILGEASQLGDALKKSKVGKRMPSAFFVQQDLDISMYLAMIDAAQGKTGKGMAGLKAVYDAAVKAKWPSGEAQASLFLALIAAKGKDPSAEELFGQALKVAQKARIPFYVWQSYFHLGRMAFEKGGNETAIKHLQQAMEVIETLRSKIEYDAQKTSFMGDKRQVYETMAQALLKKGDARAAFEVAEKAKSRALVDLLSAKQVKSQTAAGVDPALLAREQELFEQINALRDQGGTKAEAQIEPLQREYKTVLDRIKQANPELVSLKSVELASALQVQGLLNDSTVLLEFFQTENSLIVWLVSKNAVEAQCLPLSRKELANKVKSLRIMMSKPKVPAVYKLLSMLHASLMEPFAKVLEGKNLILVPDGPLHYLPFAALRDDQGKFLAERHAITLVPSANVLKYCVAKKKDGQKTLLAFGNPDLGSAKMDLPHAEAEAKSIAAKFPKAELYLRKDAKETTGKTAMGAFDIVHFACHGEMDPIRPLKSSLRLVPDSVNDGRLEAGEIFDMRLAAQLVVLSGCETGLGKIASGDEIIGLTRGFLYAGAPTVMASLWKVDDNATSVLMTTFYENLAAKGKAKALQEAQLKTMQAKKHPYYWASFFLVGDGE